MKMRNQIFDEVLNSLFKIIKLANEQKNNT
jgi:hypothetical protein